MSIPQFVMEARKQLRWWYAHAYAKPEVHAKRFKASPVPGWTFDAGIVFALLVAAAGYLLA